MVLTVDVLAAGGLFLASLISDDTDMRYGTNQVPRNEELLIVARDCYNFVTKFFELINISATHIYHSALELSPLSSIVRKLYYHKRSAPFPRIVAGTPDSWDERITISGRTGSYTSCTWSPCGQFVALQSNMAIEIRDPPTLELLSTLTVPGVDLYECQPAYSPDGHFLASISKDRHLHISLSGRRFLVPGPSYLLVIWNIQSGGIAKVIRCGVHPLAPLVWSSDGGTIGIISQVGDEDWLIYTCNITSGTTLSPGILQSEDRPQLWAHNTCFQAMTTGWDGEVFTVNIFEVGSALTKIKSFPIWLGAESKLGLTLTKIKSTPDLQRSYTLPASFSPTTHHISISVDSHVAILDIQNSKCLLKQDETSSSQCFSSDGSLFAASMQGSIYIWKYTSGHYTLWKEFPAQSQLRLQLSPTMLSILGWSRSRASPFKVWRLNDLPVVAPISYRPLSVLSWHGTYLMTAYRGGGVITITNILSSTPSHSVDTNMEVEGLALTGNILLVMDASVITAWRLMGEGIVDSVFDSRVADHHYGIWTMPFSHTMVFSVEGQTVIIGENGNTILVYHTETGEVLKPNEAPLHSPYSWYLLQDLLYGSHYPYYHRLLKDVTCSDVYEGWVKNPENNWPLSSAAFYEGWAKGPGGRCWLWIPSEWREFSHAVGWFYNITTLWVDLPNARMIIKF